MRIRTTGVLGRTDGFYWTTNEPSYGDIDGDNDGLMDPSHNYLIDLSKCASNALGRQASMMAGYKLHSITIGIRPADDNIDNDQSGQFGGTHHVRLMTDHMKEALKLARKTEIASEETQIDGDSIFLKTEVDYSGFRYGWGNTTEDIVVEHTTSTTLTSNNRWNLQDICNYYNSMTAPQQTNALFNGRASGLIKTLWACGWSNKPWGAMGAAIGDCTREMHMDIVPLVAGEILHSHVDEPGTNDDDYYVWVEVDFTVGGSF